MGVKCCVCQVAHREVSESHRFGTCVSRTQQQATVAAVIVSWCNPGGGDSDEKLEVNEYCELGGDLLAFN